MSLWSSLGGDLNTTRFQEFKDKLKFVSQSAHMLPSRQVWITWAILAEGSLEYVEPKNEWFHWSYNC